MALTLTQNPVTTVAGIVKNLFAGFLPVEFKFKREDLAVSAVGQGSNNKLLITTGVDLSNDLSIGDSAYIYSEGVNYTYDASGEVLEITATTITIDVDFIENSTGGYINYKRNYFVEAELVNEDNPAVKVLPIKLRDDGTPSGNVTIDTSIANDKNELQFEYILQTLEDARIKFRFQYREVWEGSNESFTLVSDEIILYFATEQGEVESFIQELDEAFVYEGYPFGGVLLHSDANNGGDNLSLKYDELDINKQPVVANNVIGVLSSDVFGQIFVDLPKETTYNENTEYIELKAEIGDVAFFDPAFFDGNFFETA
jgi:hypothetical protein